MTVKKHSFGAFLIIMHYGFVMALLALVSVPPTVICSAFLTSKMRKFNGEMKEVYSDSVSFLPFCPTVSYFLYFIL